MIKYNTEKFPFKKMIEDVFQVDDLEKIHTHYTYPTGMCTMKDNSNSVYHQRFYDKLRSGWSDFINVYENFINEVVTDVMDEKFIFQTTPTLRLHLVNNWATPEFHCDSQEGYNHPDGEWNFIIPLTKCYGTNSIWIESEPGKGDYKPAIMDNGNLLKFYGNKCRHGNKVNKTSRTRVTFDFRVLPLSKYKPENYTQSGTRNMKFEVGSYYKEMV
mgnify:CR=1 FL=1|tara:strand:+ start:1729 stop:2373 length:645 start_codon:yes stop_codon:yes gene_type:complete